MKVSEIRTIDLKFLTKRLNEHPTEVYTVPELAKLGWIPGSDNRVRLYVRRNMPETYQVKDDAKRLRYYGCPKVIQEVVKILSSTEGVE